MPALVAGFTLSGGEILRVVGESALAVGLVVHLDSWAL
jgi:hypothetical protein